MHERIEAWAASHLPPDRIFWSHPAGDAWTVGRYEARTVVVAVTLGGIADGSTFARAEQALAWCRYHPGWRRIAFLQCEGVGNDVMVTVPGYGRASVIITGRDVYPRPLTFAAPAPAAPSSPDKAPLIASTTDAEIPDNA